MKGMINIQYPESLANTLRMNTEDFQAEMKISAMVKLYELGKISSGIAARVLGISRIDFLELLSKYQINILGGVESSDLDEEIKNA